MEECNIDLEDCFSQDDYYSDPEQPNPEGRPCLPGEGAEALIIEAFGTREAAEEYVRTGCLPLAGRGRSR